MASSAPNFRTGVAVSSRLQDLENCLAETFSGLQDDVADESVRHHDINAVGENFRAFHVADEIQIRLFAQLRRLLREVGAFEFFAAIAENADARLLNAEIFAGVNRTDDCELK